LPLASCAYSRALASPCVPLAPPSTFYDTCLRVPFLHLSTIPWDPRALNAWWEGCKLGLYCLKNLVGLYAHASLLPFAKEYLSVFQIYRINSFAITELILNNLRSAGYSNCNSSALKKSGPLLICLVSLGERRHI
jgi:hypothetical protein